MAEAIDVQVLMQEIRDRVRQGSDTQPGLSLPPALPMTEMESLKRMSQDLHLRKALVGKLPPEPPTFRGRVGGLIVKAVRRSLFWFISRLEHFHSDMVEAFDLQFSVLDTLSSVTRQNMETLELLKGKLADVSAELTRSLAAEMAARERAEQVLRAEIAERKALTRAVAENVQGRQVLAVSYGRLEMALRQMHAEISSQAPRISNPLAEAPGITSLATPGAVKEPSPMRERQWEIGICGTFDVSNYGDLLFPFIAESELRRRLGGVTLRRFSYHAKTPPSWPYEVTSLTELPEMIHRLDGLLMGGGLLVRFDKDVAPEYAPPTPQIHHPTGYWLTPALMALQHNVPLAWNAPGMDGNDVPGWARPLVEIALALSPYVSVRDELSQAALEPLTYRPIAVVPDTAFGLPRLLDFQGNPSPEFTRLAEAYRLASPYIVFQPNLGFEGLIRVIQNHPERFGKFQFLVLPISPEFGEHPRSVDVDLPRVVRLTEWPNPLVIAELIGRSEAAVGHSYHFNITALVAGVPAFRRVDLSKGKFTALRHFDTVFVLPPDGEVDVEWFLARVGRKPPSASVLATLGPLRDHWDRIAEMFQAKQFPTAPALDRFWQSLPGLLENAETREATVHARPDEVSARLLAVSQEFAKPQNFRGEV